MERGELLTAEEAMERLGVSRATFWALVKRYDVPKYTIPIEGRRVFFKPEDLDNLKRARPKE